MGDVTGNSTRREITSHRSRLSPVSSFLNSFLERLAEQVFLTMGLLTFGLTTGFSMDDSNLKSEDFVYLYRYYLSMVVL